MRALTACKMPREIALLFLFFLPLLLSAQNTRTVSGQVRDASADPVAGASVMLKGSDKGVSTDVQGRFTITDGPDDGVLVITSTGYAAQEISVSGKTSID